MVGDADEHACDAIDVYMGGGATHAGGVPITEATLHIREVLYNEIPSTPPEKQFRPGRIRTSPFPGPTTHS
jgi:hypothetical protein